MADSEETFSALIVDDNWYNRDIFRITLQMAGYTVEEAENGQKGLEALNEKRYNLLILDLDMPVMNGEETLKRIRKSTTYNDLVILIITAKIHMADSDTLNLADHILQKPIDIVSFTKFIQRLKATF